jgi:integrase
MKKIKITKAAVDALPLVPPDLSSPTGKPVKQVDYFDTELKGFGCRVSATSKTYFVMRRVNGKLSRVTLGRHGIITADKARHDAAIALGDLTKGIDINRQSREKAKARERELANSLQQVYAQYLASRPQMKARTIAVDKSLLQCHISDWMNKPVTEITREMIARRHLKIAEGSGTITANNVMRLFRRIYNFAISLCDGDLPQNPVQRLSDSRQWFKVGRRMTVIKEHELSRWYATVMETSNPVIRDYMLLLLFTGLRKNEGLGLRWQDVDMEGRTFTVAETKNGRPHTLPMSDFLFDIFRRRAENRGNDFVFPGGGKGCGRLTEPKRQVQAIIKGCGIKFCLHDLRRTFASISEGVVSYSELKRLLNHSTANDVSQGYIILSTDKLRSSMQRITDVILGLIEPKEAGKVLPFRPVSSEQ